MKTKNLIIPIIILFAVAVGIGSFFGVSSQSSVQTSSSDLVTSEVSSVYGLKVGDVAPDFSSVDLEKGAIKKADFEGKPLFTFFTTSWCVPCQIGAQNLARYDDEKGGDAFNTLIIFIDEREPDSFLTDWKEKFGREDWYIVKDTDLARSYNVQFLDTKYVLDKDGVVKWVNLAPLEYPTIDRILGPLLV